MEGQSSKTHHIRIRTITAFLTLRLNDFDVPSSGAVDEEKQPLIASKIRRCSEFLQLVRHMLEHKGRYEVQTIRIATNPFGEWLVCSNSDDVERRLHTLDRYLTAYGIDFCSLGPSSSETLSLCPKIIAHSPRFYTSFNLTGEEKSTAAAAETILQISKLEKYPGGLGNFRFCAAANCSPFIPFFPVAKSDNLCLSNKVGFAIGLENGRLANILLSQCQTLRDVNTVFREGMLNALTPIDDLCKEVNDAHDELTYLGIDTSLNPSLEVDGSVATAIERLLMRKQNLDLDAGGTQRFTLGQNGSLAAVAAITKVLQSLGPTIRVVPGSYCGLMLPVCEDQRLAALVAANRLKILNLLMLSSVCGVGVDTVPIPGDCSISDLSQILLDVEALASRYNKSLTCRVFPVPNLTAGDFTVFDSPFLCNTRVVNLQQS